MKKLVAITILAVWTLFASTPAVHAQDEVTAYLTAVHQHMQEGRPLEALKNLFPVLYEAWDQASLTLKQALLVQEKPAGYGLYKPRPSDVYQSGEPIFVYMEPVAYEYQEFGDVYRFGFDLDLKLFTADGTLAAEKQRFGEFAFESRVPNLETMIYAFIETEGWPQGRYTIELTLRDKVSGDQKAFTIPIGIAP